MGAVVGTDGHRVQEQFDSVMNTWHTVKSSDSEWDEEERKVFGGDDEATESSGPRHRLTRTNLAMLNQLSQDKHRQGTGTDRKVVSPDCVDSVRFAASPETSPKTDHPTVPLSKKRKHPHLLTPQDENKQKRSGSKSPCKVSNGIRYTEIRKHQHNPHTRLITESFHKSSPTSSLPPRHN